MSNQLDDSLMEKLYFTVRSVTLREIYEGTDTEKAAKF
jgi:hypothetical protein